MLLWLSLLLLSSLFVLVLVRGFWLLLCWLDIHYGLCVVGYGCCVIWFVLRFSMCVLCFCCLLDRSMYAFVFGVANVCAS